MKMRGLSLVSNASQGPSFPWWKPIQPTWTQEQNERIQLAHKISLLLVQFESEIMDAPVINQHI